VVLTAMALPYSSWRSRRTASAVGVVSAGNSVRGSWGRCPVVLDDLLVMIASVEGGDWSLARLDISCD
jgi:hypothetical protein